MNYWFSASDGAKSGNGFGWWLKNQKWDLITMKDSKLLGLSGQQIHTLVHGNKVTKGAVTHDWSQSWLGGFLRYNYGTPTWLKTGVNYGASKTINSLR